MRLSRVFRDSSLGCLRVAVLALPPPPLRTCETARGQLLEALRRDLQFRLPVGSGHADVGARGSRLCNVPPCCRRLLVGGRRSVRDVQPIGDGVDAPKPQPCAPLFAPQMLLGAAGCFRLMAPLPGAPTRQRQPTLRARPARGRLGEFLLPAAVGSHPAGRGAESPWATAAAPLMDRRSACGTEDSWLFSVTHKRSLTTQCKCVPLNVNTAIRRAKGHGQGGKGE